VAEPESLVPDSVRWWLAHEGCGAIVWDGDTSVILGANATAGRLLGANGLPWVPGHESIRDVFGIAYGSATADLAAWLGAHEPREQRVSRPAPTDTLRLLLLSWRVPASGAVWATLCLELDAVTAHARPGDSTAAHMELLYQRSPLMYFTVDSDGRIVGVNRTGLEQLGYARDELVGRHVADVFHPDDREAARRQVTMGFREPEITHAWELRKCRRDGSVLWVEEWARAVPGPHNTAELLVVCQDITARRAAEQALRESEALLLQAQKQEALGRMAGGIAHDFGNLLTVVLGHCDAARQLLPRDSPVQDEVQGIREAAQQATNLSRQLLTFSRRQVVQPEPQQIDDVVARMTPLFRRLLGARILLDVVWVPGLPHVLADPGQLEQVLTNLIVNARDAIAGDGSVRITTSLVSASAFTDETGITGQPGRTYLSVSIRDDGAGMSEDVRRRAFEPFFTTKADDRGTGLGLPTVQAIVTQAGGGIALHTAPGAGCDVRVYLPTIPVPTTSGPVVSKDPRTLPGGHETILLVEDREAVRRVAQRFLARRGYQVLEAESAEQALEIAQANAGAIDLLLSDVILGGMDGYALAVALTSQQPGLRVVLMSGYPSEMLSRAGVAGPVFPFVNKPIDFPTLAQLLRDQLERRGP
jgi:two-component system, cell cycle sensor histidine kinase and response regulator CckA